MSRKIEKRLVAALLGFMGSMLCTRPGLGDTSMYEFSQRAYAGDADAQFIIGFDQQSRAHYDEAFTWYTRAAEHGQVRAQYCLAELYAQGLGVRKSQSEAAKWYRRAAELGDDQAQCALGKLYESGEGVPHDDLEAANLYRRAADQGNAKAQNNLGMMYARGVGVPKNLDEARKWLVLSAAKGNTEALANLDILGQEATAKEPVVPDR
jgi:uncharacterized protein